MKQTPKEILEDFIATVLDIDIQNDIIKSMIEQATKKALIALEEAYTLSEAELMRLERNIQAIKDAEDNSKENQNG